MTARRCEVCETWIYSDFHKYPPLWEVAIVSDDDVPDDDDYRRIYAHNAEEAAEKATEQDDSDSAEYSIVKAGDSGDFVAWVRRPGGEAKRYSVIGESVPQYTAREL